VRIQGELLKLGIGVSATTIATVLRSSGLGPAPRRIGPSWSQFLRSQAHSMVGGSSSPAAGDDDLGDDASEPSGSPQLRPDRHAEAGDHFSRRMPSSHVQPLIQSGAGRRRRGRAVSMRPQGHCGAWGALIRSSCKSTGFLDWILYAVEFVHSTRRYPWGVTVRERTFEWLPTFSGTHFPNRPAAHSVNP
jgi:hypothetical protein